MKTMGDYCDICKKYTANKNSSARKTKKNRLMLLSNCAISEKETWLLIKIMNSKILITFEMIK